MTPPFPPPDRSEDPEDGAGANPFAAMFGALGGPADLGAALHRVADLLSEQSGPVNWRLARQTAMQGLAGDPGTIAADTEQVSEAVRLAEVWLDAHTTLPAGTTSAEAWSRRRWVEATLPAWEQLCTPVAAQVAGAMTGALPEELRGVAGPMLGVMQQLGGALFGMQVGQALAALAGEVVSSTEVGLPLGPAGRAALLPVNIVEFGRDLSVPPEEVRIFLALREAAHHRLFGHVSWLRAHLVDAVQAYASGITVDPGAIESAMRDVDPSDMESLQRALSGGLFEPQTTPAQQQALRRLETMLALVEGWVDEVTGEAARDRLPNAAALAETVRRRRASGGPAEQTFATLVGLELRPRRLREAATLWRLLREARTTGGRDALWAHPDLMPGADDLDDPQSYVERSGGPEVDLGELDAGG